MYLIWLFIFESSFRLQAARGLLAGGCVVLGALGGTSTEARAQAVLIPNASALPGELGYLLGGAYTALASGGESLWFNPAGLAQETRPRLTVGGSLVRWQHSSANGTAVESGEMGPGSIAYADVLGQDHGFPRIALGYGFADVGQQRLPTRFDTVRQGTGDAFPVGFPLPGGFDADFPEGVTVRESGSAEGAQRVLGSSVGLAVAPADWLRVGLGLHLERVSLRLRSQGVTRYEASAAGGANTVAGDSQLAWTLAGDSLRLTTVLGVQADLAQRIAVGITLRLPSDTLRGSGELTYQRADRIAIGIGAPVSPQQQVARVAEDGLVFRVDTPRRWQIGLALRTDRFLMELDLYRSEGGSPRDALPATETQPPSTLALVLPPVRTEASATLGMALGMAYARTDRTSLVLGLASHPAPVTAEDGLYRAVPVTVVSLGVYHLRGDLSGSLGLVYRQAGARDVPFAPPDGAPGRVQDVDVREVAVQAAGSLAF